MKEIRGKAKETGKTAQLSEGSALPASFTVEAAVLFPILFFCLLTVISAAFRLSGQIQALLATAGAGSGAESHADTCLLWLRMTGMLKEVIK